MPHLYIQWKYDSKSDKLVKGLDKASYTQKMLEVKLMIDWKYSSSVWATDFKS